MAEIPGVEKADVSETECPVCGPVAGRIEHVVEEVERATDRLALAEEYLKRRGRDPSSVEWETVAETLDHVANLRRRSMGFETREELEERWSQ